MEKQSRPSACPVIACSLLDGLAHFVRTRIVYRPSLKPTMRRRERGVFVSTSYQSPAKTRWSRIAASAPSSMPLIFKSAAWANNFFRWMWPSRRPSSMSCKSRSSRCFQAAEAAHVELADPTTLGRRRRGHMKSEARAFGGSFWFERKGGSRFSVSETHAAALHFRAAMFAFLFFKTRAAVHQFFSLFLLNRTTTPSINTSPNIGIHPWCRHATICEGFHLPVDSV